MTILYNIASRGRPEQLKGLIENIKEMSGNNDYCFYFLVKLDTDDQSDYSFLDTMKGVKVIVDNHISKIHAINNYIDKFKAGTFGWSVLVNVSDDQRFTTKGFDEIIRKHCGLDTFLHCPDEYKKAACSTMSILGRTYYNRFGYVYNPAYYSLWSDVEATEVAKLLGCYKYIPDIIHEHQHYSTGYPMDDLYKRNNTYKKDRSIYLTRRAHNFDLRDEHGVLIKHDPYLLIKYATRGRWRQFFAAIDNIYATIRTNQFKILVTADTDDVEMNCSEVKEFVKRYHNVELSFGAHGSKVEAINADMNPMTQWKWSVVMSDDMEFTEPGWDYKMMADVRSQWPEGWDWFAHFNDAFVGDKLPTLNVCGRAWYDRFGYFYHPAYSSVSCDAENMFVAQMLERYAYFDAVYFRHNHPSNLHEPSDYIYRRNHAAGAKDTETYFARLKDYFGVKEPVYVPEQMTPYL